jgi:hypothetical protein
MEPPDIDSISLQLLSVKIVANLRKGSERGRKEEYTSNRECTIFWSHSIQLTLANIMGSPQSIVADS